VSEATQLLRPGLLEDVSLLVAGAADPSEASFGDALREACRGLGADLHTCVPDVVDEASADAAVSAVLVQTGSLNLLVVDGAGLFAKAGLRACLDATWNFTRAVVNHAFLPADPLPDPRRIVYLAPPPGAGEHADAARAGLENLARTLSTEWARHGITVVTIAPGERTAAGEVAALTAYLASPAGAYFSGCLLDLRGP
jgi:NAD(P)-dependent dehydrogenase (short-subunit alcohol dehydrogenase family)